MCYSHKWWRKNANLYQVPDSSDITLLTYSMELHHSWEANWFSANQEIPCILGNPKVHYSIQKCLSVPILSQIISQQTAKMSKNNKERDNVENGTPFCSWLYWSLPTITSSHIKWPLFTTILLGKQNIVNYIWNETKSIPCKTWWQLAIHKTKTSIKINSNCLSVCFLESIAQSQSWIHSEDRQTFCWCIYKNIINLLYT